MTAETEKGQGFHGVGMWQTWQLRLNGAAPASPPLPAVPAAPVPAPAVPVLVEARGESEA